MPVEFVDFEDARRRDGLRMVVVSGVPSPWGEAAKGLLYVKQIPWVAVRLDVSNRAMIDWTGQRSGPVAMYEDESPRSGWAEILILAERLAPKPALLPSDALQRALAFGISHEICGEGGLGWCRRLQGVHAGMSDAGGFPKGVAEYLGPKYGYRPEEAATYDARVTAILEMLARRLRAQREGGSRFYLGDSLSAVDIYSAAFMALFRPLPQELCPMPDFLRALYTLESWPDAAPVDPGLLEHRDAIYRDVLSLPLEF